MYKSCPKCLFWVHLDANKHFHSKSRTNFDDFKESLLVVKNYHFWEMTPCYPTLWVWCWKIVDTSKTCKILLYFGKWQICPLFVSRSNTYEWVSESLKCTKVAVNDFVVCIWMQTKNFTPKHYSELQRNFRMFFEKWPQASLLDVEWVELS